MNEPIAPTLESARTAAIQVTTTPQTIQAAKPKDIVTIQVVNYSATDAEVTIGAGINYGPFNVPTKSQDSVGPFSVEGDVTISASADNAIRALVLITRAVRGA